MRHPRRTPRRIAMVSEHASPLAALGGADAGGQNVYVARLAGQLARQGHEVTVYTRRDDARLPPRVSAEGFTVEHVAAGPPTQVPKDELLPYMATFGERLAKEWTARPPDVVHAHFWMSGAAALAGARGLGLPVVLTYHALGTVKRRHQGPADTSPPERIAVEAELGRLCRTVLATCADEVRELLAMGVPPHRVTVVPCGVDTDHFSPVAAARQSGQGSPRTLLAVGRLVPRKGFDRAVRALRHLPDAHLLIAGGPDASLLFADPEAERLRKIAAECEVSDRVTLLGAVPHAGMPALLSRADLVLSLPQYEPFGIVPIEAMSCGAPVVATAVGGQLDTVVDQVTGAHVPGRPDGPGPDGDRFLVRVVRDLLDDPDRLARYGAAGRRRALDHYTWDRVADGVARVYEGAVTAPPLSEAAR
ncbi:glycosyltransferase [Streptomyces sp. NPDC058374]|uniref:glycosyltransferase n=1 Tax=unclassified Streptomyces TaxID=2593676 RepID=UPI003663D761